VLKTLALRKLGSIYQLSYAIMGSNEQGLRECYGTLEEHSQILLYISLLFGNRHTSNIAEDFVNRLDLKSNQADGCKRYDTSWAVLKMLIVWH